MKKIFIHIHIYMDTIFRMEQATDFQLDFYQTGTVNCHLNECTYCDLKMEKFADLPKGLIG